MSFADWWSTINWGSAPEWVAGLFTSASVLLAIIILGGDKKRARRARADSFVTWLRTSGVDSSDDPGMKWQVFINAFNAGETPIPYAVVLAPIDISDRSWEPLKFEELGASEDLKDIVANDMISPKEAVVSDFEYGSEKPNEKDFYILFVDSSGAKWCRQLATNRYVSTRKGKRINEIAQRPSHYSQKRASVRK